MTAPLRTQVATASARARTLARSSEAGSHGSAETSDRAHASGDRRPTPAPGHERQLLAGKPSADHGIDRAGQLVRRSALAGDRLVDHQAGDQRPV